MDITATALVGSAAYLAYLFVKYPDRAIGTEPRPDLKGPKGLPLIGNVLQYNANSERIVEWLTELDQEFGRKWTSTIPAFGRVISYNDPEILEYVLKTNFENYTLGEQRETRFVDVLGHGIFNSDGPAWKRQRKTASHIFNIRNFREMISGVFQEEGCEVLRVLGEKADKKQDIDMQDLFFRFTMDSFGKISFGTSFGCLSDMDKPVPFAVAFDYAQKVIDHRLTVPWWRLQEMFSSTGRQMREAINVLNKYADDVIHQRRRDIAEGKEIPKKDLLALFMDVRDDEGNELTDLELRDVFLNFMIAGRDTTAQALSWLFYNLTQHPEVEERLVAEIKEKFDDESPNYEIIKDMKYAHAVFQETLRLYPSVPRNGRQAVNADTLPDGTHVEPKTMISYSTWAMGRSKELWGPDAEEWKPDRFMGNEPGTKASAYKFIAFNAGPRICLGQQFATLEAITVMSMILKKFRFSLSPGQPKPRPSPSLTLPMKDPLMMCVYPRQ